MTGTVIVLARDVSRVVALRESLRRSERMSVMGELVSGVAHQVRNPLFGISAALDECREAYGHLPDFREHAQTLRREIARLSHLMNHLLEYGRAGSVASRRRARLPTWWPAPSRLAVARPQTPASRWSPRFRTISR